MEFLYARIYMHSPVEEKDVSCFRNSRGFFFVLINTLLVVNNRKISLNKIRYCWFMWLKQTMALLTSVKPDPRLQMISLWLYLFLSFWAPFASELALALGRPSSRGSSWQLQADIIFIAANDLWKRTSFPNSSKASGLSLIGVTH